MCERCDEIQKIKDANAQSNAGNSLSETSQEYAGAGTAIELEKLDRDLLREQHLLMRDLSRVLDLRIKRFPHMITATAHTPAPATENDNADAPKE